jgi:hypothetical protein
MTNLPAQDYISANLLANANVLIYKLFQNIEHLPEEEQEALYDLQTAYDDYENPAKAAGWEEVLDPTWFVFHNSETQELTIYRQGTESQAWRELLGEIDFDALDPLDYEGLDLEDHQGTCEELGWELVEDATFFNEASAAYSQAESWQDLCIERGIKPDYTEAYEHWIVSPRMVYDLQEHGEKVVEFMDLSIWPRAGTGSAVHLDEVIQQIVTGKSVQ